MRNGRLGITPNSGIDEEEIFLNDITLWSGGEQDANNYKAHKYLPEIRKLLLSGGNAKAEALVNKYFICTGKGSEDVPFGEFQVLGRLRLKFNYDGLNSNEYSNYRRELVLDSAIARSNYTIVCAIVL